MYRYSRVILAISFCVLYWQPAALGTPTPTATVAPPTSTPSAPATASPTIPPSGTITPNTPTVTPSGTVATSTPVVSPTPASSPSTSPSPATVTPTPTSGLDMPDLIAPANDARFGDGSAPFEFDWTDIDDALLYDIELAIDPEFTMTSGPIQTTSSDFDLGNLGIDEDEWQDVELSFYWRARAVNTLGDGPWSPSRVVHKSSYQSSTIISPLNGSRYTVGDRMPDFEWESTGGIDHYEMEFSLDEDFLNPLPRVTLYTHYLDLSGSDSSAWDTYVGLLYWRVAVVSAEDVHGPWSQPFWFAKTTLQPPDILSPDAEANFASQSDPIDFTWQIGTDDASWQFQLSLTDDFEAPFDPLPCDDPSLLLSTMISPELWWTVYGTFYWRVAGVTDSDIPGPWSAPRRFTKIGRHRFLAWGDSITQGECVENGYSDMILPELQDRFPDAAIVNEAEGGKKSYWGAENMENRLQMTCPEFVFILFGDNDTVDPGNCVPSNDCRVDDHIQEMIDICREYSTTPIISTLIPINPDHPRVIRQEVASEWSEAIRNVVAANGETLADQEEYFFAYPNLPALYCYYGDPDYVDWVHPNVTGYQIMVDCYIDALDDLLGY